MSVSAVIVTWNSARVIERCLGSLTDPRSRHLREIIVIDNGSSDGTVALVRERFPDVTVIANPDNRGLPAANNQGMRAASGDYFLISNPDVVYQPGAVDELVAAIERHPRAGWVVPRLMYEDGTLHTSAGDLPTLKHALLGRRFERRRGGVTDGFWWDGWAHDEERAIGRGHEAAYLVRRAMVDDVGPQDERFVLDWEGIDWTARLRDRSWEVWLAPEARAIHLGGASIRQVPLRWIVSSHRGMYRYFAKRHPRARIVLAPLIAARGSIKAAGLAFRLSTYELGHRS